MSERQNINGWIGKFLRFLQVERRASVNTIAGYRRDLLQFADFLAETEKTETAMLAQFSRPAVRRFLSQLYSQKQSARTVARKLASLRAFARFLIREQAIDTNPALNIASPKIKRAIPSVLSRQEMKALLQLPDVETFEGLRDLLILELFYATGMRVSELAFLQLDHVRMQEHAFRIEGKGGAIRILPMGEIVLRDLQAYLQAREKNVENDTPFIFVNENNKSFTRQQIAGIVQQYIRRVASDDKAHPHALRHTYATHLLDEGADLMSVKELLGHKNLSTTQIYTHVSANHLKQAYRRAHPRQGRKGGDPTDHKRDE